MKATGILRRIDDLGRIVIPKEIRRSMHIKENDTFEIFIDQWSNPPMVCFAKYDPSFSKSLETLKEDILMAMTERGAMQHAEAFAEAMKKAEKIYQNFEKVE